MWWARARSGSRRPHLIVTRDAAIPLLNALLAVPATQTMRGLPSEVELGLDDGMPEVCVLTLDNLTLVPRDRFEQRICALTGERLNEVCAALRHAVDC